jgi:hypothetical protein
VKTAAQCSLRRSQNGGTNAAPGAAMTTKQDTQRGLEILAKTVYRDLKQQGYSRADILSFASSILEQVTSEAKSNKSESLDSTV